MTRGLDEQHWRKIFELSETVAALPAHERSAYLTASGTDSAIAIELLELTAQFQETEFHEDEPGQSQPAARLGHHVGRFEITGFLGSGGMGEVYRARDTELDRPVALKFLHSGVTASPGAYRQFLREARTASLLNHPNIVTIHEIVRTETTIAIVMELVEGVPLRVLCGGEPVETNRVLAIGEQMAQALAAAHRAGVVHSDIKPENVVIQANGQAKILDFGLARRTLLAANGSSLSPLAGTLRYLSPEQAAAEPATTASDIFSLGIVLHELATREHPFAAASPLETAHAILTSATPNFVRDNRFPASFWTLVEEMLANAPERRPSAEDVARRLTALRGEIDVSKRPTPARLRHHWSLAAIAATLALGLFLWTTWPPASRERFANLRIQPLTSQPGWEAAPALSPDGKSIAFTWSEKLDTPQIYVKRFDKEDPVQLTHENAGRIGFLAWSPDGTRIAFKRQFAGKGAIYSVPVTGGPETLLVDLALASVSSAVDWAPDGIRLASSDSVPNTERLAIFVYNLQTGEKTRVTDPPSNVWGDWNPKFSPDGKTIAFKQVTGFWSDDMYLVPVAGGKPRRTTTMSSGIWGHAWTADGKSLLVSCQRESTIFGIWRFPIDGPAPPERIQQGGADSITPATARTSNRIAWVNQVWNLNIYRADISKSQPPVRLISSTQRDQSPAYAPDGRIAFVSDRSGSREIWIANADGSSQTRITNFKGPQIDHLMWSPAGSRLTFDSRPRGQAEVFTIDCEVAALRCGDPKMLASSAESPSWSADGKAIFYASRRNGVWQIWKRQLAGGPAQRVIQDGGYYSRASHDGRWLYFSKGETGIFRRNLAQGEDDAKDEFIVGSPWRLQSVGWALTPQEILFIEQPAKGKPASIRAVSLATRQVRLSRDLGESFANRQDISISASPDGRWVIYPRLDSSGANVMIAETL